VTASLTCNFFQTIYIFECISLVKRCSLSLSFSVSLPLLHAILPLLNSLHYNNTCAFPPYASSRKSVCTPHLVSDKNWVRVVGGPQKCLFACRLGAELRERVKNIRRTTGRAVIWTVKKYKFITVYHIYIYI
jgi:hypothetical protein